jgi:prolyl-tRNA synthetase
MPSGRTLQLGSIHQYKDNFSKPYEISYETEKGTHAYCHQTTYGMSERILGALVGIHGDNKGLVMPPEVAPKQVIIIPIIFKGKEKEVLNACDQLCKKLTDENIRVNVDKRDITPGNKYYDLELKGVPVRIEIGPKDVQKKEIVLVRRDTGKKMSVLQKDAVKHIKYIFGSISTDLYSNAKQLLDNNMHRVKTIEEAKKKEGIVELPWCGNENCAQEVETILDGNTLGEPIENVKCKDPCPVCGQSAKTWMRYAKTY